MVYKLCLYLAPMTSSTPSHQASFAHSILATLIPYVSNEPQVLPLDALCIDCSL